MPRTPMKRFILMSRRAFALHCCPSLWGGLIYWAAVFCCFRVPFECYTYDSDSDL
jgi:hypothetical protein